MDQLRSLLPKVLRKRGLHEQAQASLVVFRAQEWVEQALPRHGNAIHAASFSRTILRITCAHGIAAQECRHVIPALLDHLRAECPGVVISDVRLERA